MVDTLIVCGDDGSVGADVAWGWINAQQWNGWPVDVVTGVYSVVHPDTSGARELHEWSPPSARHALAIADLGPIRFLTADEDPRLLLRDHAGEGLLVVGARGAGGLEGMLMGSTSDWLMRDPKGPLVIVRDASPVRSVVVAVDGSSDAMAATQALSDMPWISACTCEVVTVTDAGVNAQPLCDQAAEVLSRAGAAVSTRVLEVDAWHTGLSPATLILRHVHAVKPDLVVMGTQGRTGLARLWFGSVAGAVAQHAETNVMLCHAKAAS